MSLTNPYIKFTNSSGQVNAVVDNQPAAVPNILAVSTDCQNWEYQPYSSDYQTRYDSTGVSPAYDSPGSLIVETNCPNISVINYKQPTDMLLLQFVAIFVAIALVAGTLFLFSRAARLIPKIWRRDDS